MNTQQLQYTLLQMAADQTKYHFEYCKAIVNCIIQHYLTFPAYYEEHAIATMTGFLKRGVLTW